MKKKDERKWLKIHEEPHASELTQAQFCEERGISLNPFRYRLNLLKKEGLLGDRDKGPAVRERPLQESPGFIVIEVKEPRDLPEPDYCQIKFSDGSLIRINSESVWRHLQDWVRGS